MKQILILFSVIFLVGNALSVAASHPDRGGGITKVDKYENYVNEKVNDQYHESVVKANEQTAYLCSSNESVSFTDVYSEKRKSRESINTIENNKQIDKLYLLNCCIRRC